MSYETDLKDDPLCHIPRRTMYDDTAYYCKRLNMETWRYEHIPPNVGKDNIIEKVTVYDDHFTVEFKSGLETDVTM